MVIAGQSSFPALGDSDQVKIRDSPKVDREGPDGLAIEADGRVFAAAPEADAIFVFEPDGAG
jgi:gluconolactonase